VELVLVSSYVWNWNWNQIYFDNNFLEKRIRMGGWMESNQQLTVDSKMGYRKLGHMLEQKLESKPKFTFLKNQAWNHSNLGI
jgi:hypothetical protein